MMYLKGTHYSVVIDIKLQHGGTAQEKVFCGSECEHVKNNTVG